MTDQFESEWNSLNDYERAAAGLLVSAGVTVSKYRTRNTGVARPDRTIEAPRPRGPISFATLAHEVGHIVLGHTTTVTRKPRWQEEVEAWEFALTAVEKFKLKGYERVEADAAKAIGYAFYKAIRRGASWSTIRDTYPVWWSRVGLRPSELSL